MSKKDSYKPEDAIVSAEALKAYMTDFASLDIEHKQHLLINLCIQEKLISTLTRYADDPETKRAVDSLVWKLCEQASASILDLSEAELDEKIQKIEGLLKHKLRQVSIRANFG